jgi:hypothetical protein
MKLWLTYKAVMLTLVSLAAFSVLMELRRFVRDLDVSVRMSDTVLANVNQSTRYLEKTASNLDNLTASEVKRINASTLEFQKTEASTRLLIVRTNESLNGGPHVAGLFPQATATISSAQQLAESANEGLRATTDLVRPSLDNLARATANAADTLADPAIKASLDNLAATSTSVAGVSADAKLVADKVTQDYLKPQKFAWELVKQLAGLGGSFAQMIK